MTILLFQVFNVVHAGKLGQMQYACILFQRPQKSKSYFLTFLELGDYCFSFTGLEKTSLLSIKHGSGKLKKLRKSGVVKVSATSAFFSAFYRCFTDCIF